MLDNEDSSRDVITTNKGTGFSRRTALEAIDNNNGSEVDDDRQALIPRSLNDCRSTDNDGNRLSRDELNEVSNDEEDRKSGLMGWTEFVKSFYRK